MTSKLSFKPSEVVKDTDGFSSLRPADSPRISRRATLPSGRAVLGALLVTSAALAAYLAARPADPGPATTYVVAARPLSVGEVLDTSDLALVAADLPASLVEASYTDVTAVMGQVTLGPIGPGELIQAQSLVASTDGEHGLQVTLPVDVRHAPPRLAPGETVAVLATTGSGAEATTVVTVGQATVVAYTTDDGALSGDEARLTISVDSPESILAVTRAAHSAEVTVVRTTGSAGSFTPATSLLDASSPDPLAAPDAVEVVDNREVGG